MLLQANMRIARPLYGYHPFDAQLLLETTSYLELRPRLQWQCLRSVLAPPLERGV